MSQSKNEKRTQCSEKGAELERLVRCWMASEAYLGGDPDSVGPNHRPSERRPRHASVAPAPTPVSRVHLIRRTVRAGSLPPRRVPPALR